MRSISAVTEQWEEDTYLQLSGQSHPWDVYWLRAVAMTGIIGGLEIENTVEHWVSLQGLGTFKGFQWVLKDSKWTAFILT